MADILKTDNPCPAVSVVIPLYNSEKFIGECLDSLRAQTFKDFEVIVIDDCSTDNSVNIVEEYAPKFDGRLILSKTEKNSGGGGYVPRNIGIKLASGEYICFLDADDYLSSTALETLYNAAKRYDAEVVYTASYYKLNPFGNAVLCSDGEEKKLAQEGFKNKIEFRVDDCERNLRKLLLEEYEGNFRNPWSKFVRRDFLITNEIYFPAQMATGGDFIWVINVYCHAKSFLRLPTPLYFYRHNTFSVT